METFSALPAFCVGNSPVNYPNIGKWRGALMFSLIFAWTNGWVNNHEAGDLIRHRAHYDVIVMLPSCCRGNAITIATTSELKARFLNYSLNHQFETSPWLLYYVYFISCTVVILRVFYCIWSYVCLSAISTHFKWELTLFVYIVRL